jgi:hypothetical protein
MSWQINPRLLRSEPLSRCGFPTCKAACCLYGVWVDLGERDRILGLAGKISKLLPKIRSDPAQWFENTKEADPHTPSGKVVHTRVLADVDHYGSSSCIFLRPDHKCALQLAGERINADGWSLKPFYCILHPLDLDEEGRITLDETQLLVEEAASCLVPSGDLVPLLTTFAPELRFLLGEDEFGRLLQTDGE